jgi:pilus assembly protein CpaF
MVSMAGLNFPVRAIRQQVSSALNILVHLDRLTGGRRKVVCVAEISGMEGDMILLQDVFRFRQVDIGPDGHARGCFESCGVRPKVIDQLEAEGIKLSTEFFARRVLSPDGGNGKVTWRNR